MKSPAEKELIEKVLDGDKLAYHSLFNHYYKFCLAKASGIVGDYEVSKDLVQESFIYAYFKLGSLRDKNLFKLWLGGIVSNVCQNYIRVKARKSASLQAYVYQNQASEDTEDVRIISIISTALKTLDNSFSSIIDAFYYQGKSIPEISAEFGITPSLVKVRLHRARKELKDILIANPEITNYQPTYKKRKTMKKVNIIELLPSQTDKAKWTLLLLEEESNQVLPIIIGAELAATIAANMKGVVLPRPLTHNLFVEILNTNGLLPEGVYISDIKNGIYIATLKVKTSNGIKEYDARPSDAINIAVLTGCPIFVSQAILHSAGIAVPEKYHSRHSLEKGIDQLLQIIENEKIKTQEQNSNKKSSADLQQYHEKLLSFVFEE